MILKIEQVEKYRDLSLDQLKGRIAPVYMDLLLRVERSSGEPALYELLMAHHLRDQSLVSISRQMGRYDGIMHRLFSILDLPKLTPEENKRRNVRLRIGVHGASSEQRRIWGSIGGNESFHQGKGFYGASKDKHSEWTRRAGRISVKIRREKSRIGFLPEEQKKRAALGGQSTARLHRIIRGEESNSSRFDYENRFNRALSHTYKKLQEGTVKVAELVLLEWSDNIRKNHKEDRTYDMGEIKAFMSCFKLLRNYYRRHEIYKNSEEHKKELERRNAFMSKVFSSIENAHPFKVAHSMEDSFSLDA